MLIWLFITFGLNFGSRRPETRDLHSSKTKCPFTSTSARKFSRTISSKGLDSRRLATLVTIILNNIQFIKCERRRSFLSTSFVRRCNCINSPFCELNPFKI